LAQSEDVSVRTLAEADMPRIARLYETVSVENPHFVRSQPFLKYFVHHPEVDAGGVFVAEENDDVTGFGIVSITVDQGGLKQANIIEIKSKDARSVQALIEAIMEYCRAQDVDALIVAPPPLPEIDEIMKDWLKLDTGVMMGKSLNLSPLILALLSTGVIRSAYPGGRIVFRVGTETVEASIPVENVQSSGKVNKTEASVIQVSMSQRVFLQTILGQLNPLAGFLTGKIRINGLLNVPSALKLLGLMIIHEPFYTSLADRM